MKQDKERASKFNVGKDKTTRSYDGIVFDSAVEMKFYVEVVCPLLESGEIIKTERQKSYTLQPSFMRDGKKIKAIEYKADFYLEYADGREQIIDIKGHPDAGALLKRKMFWYVYPDKEYIWLGYSKIDGGWVTYETIKDGRKKRKKLKQQENKEKQENVKSRKQ